jgi:hypothetical protein
MASAMRDLCACVAAALLAGCAQSQQAIVAPGVIPQDRTAVIPAGHSGSWMLPEAKGEDLLYADASGASAHDVYVFSYPKGKLVGTIDEPNAEYQQGLCSDAKGNVFVTTLSSNYYGGAIYRYAHGSTEPSQTLYEWGVWPWGCGSDPTTGNLAVASINLDSLSSWVEVYQHGKGKPTDYYDEQIINYTFCSYDDKGDMFVDGTGSGSNAEFGELPKGGTALMNVNLSRNVNCCGQVQWDGHHITIEDQQAGAIYRLSFSGSTGMVIGTTHLKGWTAANAQSWMENGMVIQPNGNSATEIASWRYPRGGAPASSITAPAALFGVTLSLAHR